MKKFSANLSLFLLHLIFCSCLFILFKLLKFIKFFPTNKNLLSWDAFWYYDISLHGYTYYPDKISNVAFFPGFPMFWRFLNVSPIEICIINGVLFIVCIAKLFSLFDLPVVFKMILVSTPSFIFFVLPYSESLFFLFGILIIFGYKMHLSWLKGLGFFLISLTRSIGLVLIPAIIIIELINNRKITNKGLLTSVFCCICGLFLSAYMQYLYTGKWLPFLEVQQFFKRGWILPLFPATTYSPERILGIDSLAVIIGFLALLNVLKWLYKLAIQRPIANVATQDFPTPSVLLSALYISAILILDIFFTHNVEGKAVNIWSVNRHIFATPFFIVFIIWIYQNYLPKKFETIFISIVFLSGIYFLGIYQHIEMLLVYLLTAISFIVLKLNLKERNTIWLFYLLNTIVQVFLFEDFLQFKWVG